MSKQLLKVLLIVTCQIVLLTGIIFADSSENRDSYFKFKTFEEMKPEFEDNINSEYMSEVEKLYNEFYMLEKKRKYFTADMKLKELDDMIIDIDSIITGRDHWSNGSFPIDFYNNMVDTRDYRYGFPSFEEAYELEFKDYINLVEEDKRDICKNEIKRIYGKIEKRYKELENEENTQGVQGNSYVFRTIRKELGRLLFAINIEAPVYTKDRVCKYNNVCYLKPENFNLFLEANKDIIGEDKIKRLKDLHKEAYGIIENGDNLRKKNITCREDIFELKDLFKEDKEVEKLDKIFEEIKEILRRYKTRILNLQYRESKEAIDSLYEEINVESK
ncbi:hypothetical protein [Wukongibacter sp. M2B1]|uniref:hypothetical protein n=1 Tax=Wukongibacter sp. M2B1 TaxID=3088895 RepID=UPI003D7ABA72